MSLLEIPIDSTIVSQEFQVALEGTVYTFQIEWIERDARWYLYLSDENKVSIVGGVPLNLGVDILGKYVDRAIPPGTLFVFDTTYSQVEAGIGELGDRVLLLYNESVA